MDMARRSIDGSASRKTGRPAMTTVASFDIDYTQYLGPDGEPVQPLPAFAQDAAALLPLYRAMVLTRAFDTKAVALQRTGKIGTFASSIGQEAIGVGVASAMRADDVLFPSYRDHAAQFLRGVTMTESLLYWGGDERGSDFTAARLDFPNCVPIATQVCHAAGAAYAFALRGEARVAVAVLGDGGTSKGDFYEAMNLAGAWRVPLVIVVNNNQWAISMPRARQTAARTLAQKAIAAGIEGRQIDGNDIVAVRQAVGEAIENARRGGGPALVEALSYRLGDHTTADDATRYRDADALGKQWAFEPLLRLRKHLMRRNVWDDAQDEAFGKACYAQVEEAVRAYLAVPQPAASAMFDHLYASLPHAMQEQLATALAFAPAAENHHG
ncbi:pdhA [Burkholderia humptydooensis MSMB43]|nr:pdhA [Burkholderia humptydooensis MSMB43]